MSVLDRVRSLFESSPEIDTSMQIAEKIKEMDFPELDAYQFVDQGAFSKFRELSSGRQAQYNAYDAMTKDIIISSALNMYAEDATQYDTLGRVIWVESEDPDLAEYLNGLVEILEFPRKLRSIVYSLAEYGDVYLRLFKKTKEGDSSGSLLEGLDPNVEYEDYIEVVDNPEDHFDLVRNGKTCQYAVSNKEAGVYKRDRIELYPPDQFVHIYIENTHIRDREIFEFKTTTKNGVEELHRYKVRRGKSLLHDIYAVEKEIQLIESSILLNRLSKSAITRLISVEVGDMPKTDVRKLLRRIKNQLESKLSVSLNGNRSGSINSYASPGGVDNIVVNPVRNNIGSMNSQVIGGDYDPRTLIDLDYFNNKRFGGLRIPKAFMGFDDTLGSNAGGQLTKLDSRYGRTIKNLQSSVINGVTDTLNLYLIHRRGGQGVGNFTVRLVSPTTVEDTDRDDLLVNRLNIISQFMGVLESKPSTYKNEIIDYLLVKYANDPGLAEIVARHKDDPVPNPDEEDDFR